jgi:hypothetical protein
MVMERRMAVHREYSLKLWHSFLVCRDVVGVLSMGIPYCKYCTVLARDSLSLGSLYGRSVAGLPHC